jgi:hypothetical protein
MLWVSRRQAQNAADAGALAGAISLAYSDPTDPNTTMRVKTVGVAAAQINTVWGQAPDVTVDDVVIEPCPPGAPGDPDLCVRVDVFRNQERGNPLPTWFGQMVGVAAHGVRATATAQVAMGTKTTCVKPWVIPDKWEEHRPSTIPWDLNQTYERYSGPGSNPKPSWTVLSPADNYIAPTAGDAGSGFTVPDDIGMRLTIKVESWKDSDIGPGNYRSVVFPSCPGTNSGSGGDLYRCNIANCNLTPLGIGDTLETEPGTMVGPTTQGLDELIGSDSAVWLCSDGSSSTGRDCPGYPSIANTPRLVPVPAFDVQQYFDDCISGVNPDCNGRATVKISRMLGFFIEGWDNKEIWGRFTYYPDTGGISHGEIDDDANFLRKVILVR